ncbi:MAG: response regulator [Clostridium sp.]|jgi:two-component SAPR family response regulator|uniref:response regulator n=1 Tax=Clostridium sp. TaxID=1506 RepID=UPI0025C6D78B|nr:response regulator [Clostridium sp.]MCH3964404.1 response regulator [Clostridium sp.]MCI1715579.1 response regulator [Clostridium sp.]MCI1799629.1 response regulator [Clostridium sp.]MCI1813763.1 response regulator [Clostridium sp.]MCI1870442.1 response regulator [Clostridium sp.]
MKAVVVEDEKPILKLMEMFINRNKYLEVIGGYTDSREALDGIFKLSPDVVFVDIEMPYINGVELAKQVKNFDEDIQIVFVTAYERYALQAFEVDAVNYILKPITEEDINTTVKRLLKNYGRRKNISAKIRKNEILCLGGFKVYGSSGNEIVRWSTSKVQELFAYFICNRGEETDRWNLCDMLWPDSPPKNAEHNLYSTIYRLKNVLKNVGIYNVIYYKSGNYSVDFTEFRCDAWDFEDFIEIHIEADSKNIGDYVDAVNLYKGILFGNEDYVWNNELNEKLLRYYLLEVKNIARYYMKEKSYNKSEEYLKKAISKNPFDEEAYELMMKVYFYRGDKVALMKCYDELNAMFKDELHIEPKEATERLYKALLMKL